MNCTINTRMASVPTWHVLGGGSLGLLCAFHMRQAGFTVNLLLRNSSAVSSFKQSGSCIQLLETWRKNGPQWQRSLPIQASFVPDVSASEPHVIKSHTNCGRLSTPQPYPVRRLVVATKAQDTVPALRNLLPYIEDGCQCILLQNGALAVVDQLQQELGRELGLMPTVSSQQHSHRSSPSSGLSRSESRCFTSSKHVRLYLASVTHGCYREAPLNLTATLPPNANALGVVHAGLGSITVGPLDPLLAIATCLLSTSDRVAALGSNAVASFPVQTEQADPDDASFIREMALALPGLGLRTAANSNSLLQELLAKLAANCTINPLTALLGCRNGALAELPQARAQMREVCRELVTVFGSEMFPLDRQGAANGEGAVPPCGREEGVVGTQPEQPLLEWVLSVVASTADNQSSMLQDVNGRRSTEIDYLSGWVLKVAASRAVQVPVNSTLVALVKSKEGLYAA